MYHVANIRDSQIKRCMEKVERTKPFGRQENNTGVAKEYAVTHNACHIGNGASIKYVVLCYVCALGCYCPVSGSISKQFLSLFWCLKLEKAHKWLGGTLLNIEKYNLVMMRKTNDCFTTLVIYSSIIATKIFQGAVCTRKDGVHSCCPVKGSTPRCISLSEWYRAPS